MRKLIVGILAALVVLLASTFAARVHAQVAAPIFANGFDSPIPVGCPSTINPDGIVRTRLTVSNIAYGASMSTRAGVKLDEYGAVYSYNGSAPGPVLPFPGLTGSAPRFMAFRKTSYIGLRFTVPQAMDPRSAGRWMAPTAYPGSLPITMSISRACGDFARYLPTPGCVVKGIPAADAQLVFWTFSHASPLTSCVLTPGVYYLNIIQSDPSKNPGVQAPAAWRG